MPEKIIGIDLRTSSIRALDKRPIRPCIDCRPLIK
jgi:hypothetical protein